MLLSNSGRVLIIDDEYSEACPLMEALGKQSIPYMYYNGQPHNLPSTPLGGIRFVFLDISLSGMSGQDDKTKASALISILKKIISNSNGPYVIIFWTTHHDVIELVLEKCKEASIQPVEWLDLEKAECIDKDDGTYDLEFIENKLENKLKDVNVFRFYTEWENIINQSTKEFIFDMASCFELDEDWSSNTEFLIYKLYKTFSDHGDAFSSHEKLQSAFHLLNRSFLDKLELLTRDATADHINFFDYKEVSSIFYETYLIEGGYFTTKYTISADDPSKYLLNVPITEAEIKKVCKKINIIVNTKIIGADNIAKLNSALFVSNPSRHDIPGSIFCHEDNTLKKIILDSILDETTGVESRLCFVLLTPECDIANNKAIIHRAAYGIISADLGDKNICTGDQFFKIGPFWHEDKIQNIIINFQTISTIHLDKLISHDLHLSIKRDLFFDLQSKASNHVNRLGNYQLS